MLVDDHKIVRKGLQFFLKTQADFHIVGEASNGQEALEKIKQWMPDVILLDLMMPVMDGVEATKAIRQTYKDIKIMVLTTFADQDHVIPAIQAGANGYVLKEIEPVELAKAIRIVHSGQSYLDPTVAGQVMNQVQHPTNPSTADHQVNDEQPVEALTPRETEILRYIASGLSNKEIAATCSITEKTVKTHVSNILGKLGCADRTQAAIYAVKHGLDVESNT